MSAFSCALRACKKSTSSFHAQDASLQMPEVLQDSWLSVTLKGQKNWSGRRPTLDRNPSPVLLRFQRSLHCKLLVFASFETTSRQALYLLRSPAPQGRWKGIVPPSDVSEAKGDHDINNIVDIIAAAIMTRDGSSIFQAKLKLGFRVSLSAVHQNSCATHYLLIPQEPRFSTACCLQIAYQLSFPGVLSLNKL